jgi:PTH1 family peptidyl-tRNA hydrolase
MKLIIGLGNPGKQYKNTRHNIGFIMIDTIFSDFVEEKKFKTLLSNKPLFSPLSTTVIGMKPETFMNLSGDSVSAMVSFYKLDPKKDILVISDDIDMEFGKVRFRSE